MTRLVEIEFLFQQRHCYNKRIKPFPLFACDFYLLSNALINQKGIYLDFSFDFLNTLDMVILVEETGSFWRIHGIEQGWATFLETGPDPSNLFFKGAKGSKKNK